MLKKKKKKKNLPSSHTITHTMTCNILTRCLPHSTKKRKPNLMVACKQELYLTRSNKGAVDRVFLNSVCKCVSVLLISWGFRERVRRTKRNMDVCHTSLTSVRDYQVSISAFDHRHWHITAFLVDFTFRLTCNLSRYFVQYAFLETL